MTITTIITGYLNGTALALTPVERFEAMRNLDTGFMVDRWFIIGGIIAIIVLSVVFFVVTFNRIRQERRSSGQLFDEYADKRGLSSRERQILFRVACKAQLKRNESIYTLVTAYDRGTAIVMEQGLTGHQTSEERKQLEVELSFLREKLGFKKQISLTTISPAKLKKLSSRQVPVGKKVHMTRRQSQKSEDIEAIIVKNNDNELAVRLSDPIKISFGEFWCVRYYFGSSVWEFDTSVVSYDGDMLFLNHNDEVKFINRRRFLRVPVKMSSFVANFTFERPFNEISGKDAPVMTRDLANDFPVLWEPPKFVPAVVTELAGPGLRIETSLKVKVGERVLVVFNLVPESDSDMLDYGKKSNVPQIVQDIGEVRDVKSIHNGLSIAVELTGLSDSNVNKLIRATNATSLSANKKDQLVSDDDVGRSPVYIGV